MNTVSASKSATLLEARFKTLKSSLKQIYEKSWAYDAYNWLWIFIGLVYCKIFSDTPARTHQAAVNLFCKTQARSSDRIHKWIEAFNPPYRLEHTSGFLGNLDVRATQEIVEQLDRDGFFVSPVRLPESVCNELLDFALKTDFALVGEKVITPIKYDRKNPIAIRYGVDTHTLVNHRAVQKLLCDHSLLRVAQEYLNCRPSLDLVGLTWNTAFSKEPSSDAATMFHFDWNGAKFLKVFIYLTDVTPKTAPHTFVKGTHRAGTIPPHFLKRKYQRIPDDEIENYYGRENIIEFSLPRGSILLEDTRGFHKGKHNLEGDRLIYQQTYIDSLFGCTRLGANIKTVHHDQMRTMLQEWPRLFRQFLN